MIVIVDYGACNVGSVLNMGRRAGGEFTISNNPAVIASAEKLILPGVGSFDNGMRQLNELGIVPALNEAVLRRRVPILGVCLGLQLFTHGSEEGQSPGLGWIAGRTVKFRIEATQASLKTPHLGWNSVELGKLDPLLKNLPDEPRFYFVHSYHLVCDDPSDPLLWTTHGYRFISGIRRDNIWGTQFHPEKSHKFGLALMRNFVAL